MCRSLSAEIFADKQAEAPFAPCFRARLSIFTKREARKNGHMALCQEQPQRRIRLLPSTSLFGLPSPNQGMRWIYFSLPFRPESLMMQYNLDAVRISKCPWLTAGVDKHNSSSALVWSTWKSAPALTT